MSGIMILPQNHSKIQSASQVLRRFLFFISKCFCFTRLINQYFKHVFWNRKNSFTEVHFEYVLNQ